MTDRSLLRRAAGFALLALHLAAWFGWSLLFRLAPSGAVFERARRAAWRSGWRMQDVTPEDGDGIWRRVRGWIHRAAEIVGRIAPDDQEPPSGP